MPLIVEVFLIIFVMMGSFFLAFMAMFLLALFLTPIERGLSNLIWHKTPEPKVQTAKGSFKEFSKKTK